jgi:hypothetical protein
LDNNKFTDIGIAALAPLKQLEYLNIYGKPGVTDARVATLAASITGIRNRGNNDRNCGATTVISHRCRPGSERNGREQVSQDRASRR